MNSEHLFLDLDGTLIDPSWRLYNLFCELAPSFPLSYDEYWSLKRRKINQRSLLKNALNYSEGDIADFKQLWMSRVEEPQRLATDIPYPGVTAFLSRAALTSELYLVTARQYPNRVVDQLTAFGWSHFFKEVLVTRQLKSKDEIICDTTVVLKSDTFVGDTGEDILAGKKLGVATIAVSSGFLCADVLMKYNPDRLLESVSEIYR